MAPAEASFISTSYHTERLGPAAALATIAKMKAVGAIEHNIAMGRLIKRGWAEAAESAGLEIAVSGIDPWPAFKFGAPQDAHGFQAPQQATSPLRTLFTQEMLRRGFLALDVALPSFAHKEAHIEAYLSAVRAVFADIAGWLEEAGGDEHALAAKLAGPIAGPPAIQRRLVR